VRYGLSENFVPMADRFAVPHSPFFMRIKNNLKLHVKLAASYQQVSQFRGGQTFELQFCGRQI
jgi:hypothetical protein